ncbi:MAG: HlyD family type I secretion periplasmic adaptor subunit [Victivallaceae bacterium]|nr:HlyD family type I secretion periplasmic adaptor subunit [Victivallaceae bacterium]
MNNDKINLCHEAVEYQSDALELAAQKLPWFGKGGIPLALLISITAIIWATFSEVDIIVEANGKLISSSQNIVMKPLERTVIKKINVRVGQVVKKRQVLITFDPTFNRAEEERLDEQLKSLSAQFWRLKAEFTGEDFRPKTKVPTEDEKWQGAIFNKRRKFYQEKLKYYSQNIKRIRAAINTTNESYKKQKHRLKTLKRIEKMMDDLHHRNAISLKQFLETQISRLQMESEVDKLKNSILELVHERLSAIANKNSFIEEWDKTVSEEMVKIEREVTSTSKQLDKARKLSSYVCIYAPCDAVVHEIAAFSEGSGVREAEPLITLVPINIQIDAEVNILPQDIGKVKIGDMGRIKLNAFPFQKHGTLDGKLFLISENTFQEQGIMGQKQSVYHGRMIISGKLENVPDNFRLIPGMEIRAELKVGKRRIIEYLIHPLIKALDESIREP